MTLRRSIVFATSLFEPLGTLAREAEAAGFDRVWTTEFPDRDALIRATVVGLATSRIGVATGITYSFSRHPLALAAAALDVHEAIGGRFALGLGTATAAMRNRWYGIDEDRPVGRLADAVALLRESWASSGRFKYAGPYYQGRVEGLNQAARSAALPPLPVYGSGLNAAMLRGAAASCDGLAIHPLAVGPLYAERTVAPIVAEARRARSSAGQGFSAALWVITQIDDDPVAARERARKALAFFFSTPGYETAAAGESWAGAPERIRRRFAETRGDWAAVSAEVPDDLIEAMTLCGTPEQVRHQLPALEARLADVGVDELVFQTGVDLGEAEFVANCRQIIACCAPT
jgi:alkanesulfonate monooxygenase SsuD/methylene tetrahydromethanopterin reductase-like flavin-dependent oxidoreductase (luciferase family)